MIDSVESIIKSLRIFLAPRGLDLGDLIFFSFFILFVALSTRAAALT